MGVRLARTRRRTRCRRTCKARMGKRMRCCRVSRKIDGGLVVARRWAWCPSSLQETHRGRRRSLTEGEILRNEGFVSSCKDINQTNNRSKNSNMAPLVLLRSSTSFQRSSSGDGQVDRNEFVQRCRKHRPLRPRFPGDVTHVGYLHFPSSFPPVNYFTGLEFRNRLVSHGPARFDHGGWPGSA